MQACWQSLAGLTFLQLGSGVVRFHGHTCIPDWLLQVPQPPCPCLLPTNRCRRWWHFCRTAGTTRASMADSPMPPARSLSSLFRHALCPRCEPLNFMSPTLRSTHFTPLCKPSLTLLSSNTGGSTAPTCQKTRQHFVDTCRRGRYGRPRMAADTRWQSMLQASSPTAPGTPALPAQFGQRLEEVTIHRSDGRFRS